jgi:predicted MFS family arabinose efflux permease
VSLFFQAFCILASVNVLNVLPDHLASVGASKSYIGMYMNLNSLVLVVLAVPLSDHADLFGRRRLILWGYAGGLASAGLSFLFPANLAVLVLLRGLGSLLFTVSFTIQNAEVFGRLPRERRYTGMALYGVSGLLANPIGSFSGERLAAAAGARWLFAASFAFIAAGLAAAATHRFHESAGDEAERTSFAALLRRKELYPLSVLAFLLGGAYAVFSTFLVNLTRLRLGVPTITGFFVSFSAVAIFIRLFLGSRLEVMTPRRLIVGGFLLETAAFVLAFFLSDARMLIPIGFIYGIGHSVMYPLLSTLYVNSGTDADRLGLNNLYSATNMLGNIATAIVMGGAADLTGLPTVFILMAVLCAAMVPVGVSGLSAFRRRYDAPT